MEGDLILSSPPQTSLCQFFQCRLLPASLALVQSGSRTRGEALCCCKDSRSGCAREGEEGNQGKKKTRERKGTQDTKDCATGESE